MPHATDIEAHPTIGINPAAIVTRLRDRFVAKTGERFPFASLAAYCGSGNVQWTVTLGGRRFESETLVGALNAAQEWLDRDDVTIGNLTLGMNAAGDLVMETVA